MNKQEREKLHQKYGEHCAYCGNLIEYHEMHADHLVPIWRNGLPTGSKREIGTDDISNRMPSCARCNRWKSTHTIEEFRWEISQQLIRVRRDSASYRMAFDYGMITENSNNVIFYFERHEKN